MIRQRLHELRNHPGVRKYTANISWMLFARVFTLGVSFLTTLYIARQLGPTNFGELDYALAIVGMFSIIGAWGIESVFNRELIKHPDQEGQLTGTASILRFIMGLSATILIIAFALLFRSDSLSRLLLILLSFTQTLGTLTILQQVFLARAQSKYPSLISSAVAVFTNTLKIIVIFSGKGVLYLAITLLIEAGLSALLYLFAYKYALDGKFKKWSFSATIAKTFLKTGGAIAFLSMFAMIYSRIDQIMIRHMLDATAVGLYSAGVRLVDLWGFIPTIIGIGLYPAILNARKVSEDLYVKRLRRLFLLYALPAIGIAALVSISAKPLMSLVYGEGFIDGFRALQIYVWSLPGTFIGFYVMNILFTDDYRKILVFTTAFPAVVNVLLNLAWIPTNGIIGAAWATTISYSLIPFMPLLFRHTRAVLYDIYKK
jgi:O-antigen/teichoic acid export membrane protein